MRDMTIHDILDRQRKTVTGTPHVALAGTKKGSHRLDDQQLQSVHTHIQGLATVESHYSKTKNSSRRYLPHKTKIAKLYRAYKNELKDSSPRIHPVKYQKYKQIFKNDYNLGTQPPSVDVCNTCTILENRIKGLRLEQEVKSKSSSSQKPKKSQKTTATSKKSPERNFVEEIKTLKRELNIHKLRGKRGYSLMKSYKPAQPGKPAIPAKNGKPGKPAGPSIPAGENFHPDKLAISMDLAQAFPIPKLSAGLAFYKRKAMCYNFGIHHINEDKGFMFVWDETNAKRGSNEVASCLKQFVDNFVSPHVKELTIFSDNCGGQNKNFNLVLACMSYIHSGRFEKIHHVYLMSGHSYLPCDRDFGYISRETNHEEVYSKQQYVELIKSAKLTKKFEVVEMTQEMFLDYNFLQKQVVNRKINGDKFSDGKIFLYSQDFKEGYAIQTAYSEVRPPRKVVIQKLKVPRKYSPETHESVYNRKVFNLDVQLPQLYTEPIKMSSEKLEDIKALLELVDCEHQGYLRNMIQMQENALSYADNNYENYSDRCVDFVEA